MKPDTDVGDPWLLRFWRRHRASSGTPRRAKGRTRSVDARRDAPTRYLHYGRIILDADDAAAALRDQRDGDRADLLARVGDGSRGRCGLHARRATTRSMCRATSPIDVDSRRRGLRPRGDRRAGHAAASRAVRLASPRSRRIPGCTSKPGGPAAKRDLNVLIGKNVQAGRIMAGVTFSEPGNWTSWPPHEHAAMLEEAYLYIDMPAPAFGVQLVYTNTREPEVATIVREGDVVLMPAGYHPNVAAPGDRHQLPLDDGGQSRRRRPPVRRRQRATGIRGHAVWSRRRESGARNEQPDSVLNVSASRLERRSQPSGSPKASSVRCSGAIASWCAACASRRTR